MSRKLKIGNREIGEGSPAYLIAEMSGNHNGEFERAKRLLREAKMAGAEAIKLQTYTADTLTIDSGKEYFRVKGGTPWDDRTLYDLYQEAHTPWDWQPELKTLADDLGLQFFSSPFDRTAVDFLEKLNVVAYKIASFEIVDLPLIRYAASTGKPMIISTGLATRDEISDAVQAAREAGSAGVALLKCTSAYPAPYNEMNLRAIQELENAFGVPAGLSDHTLGNAVACAAVSLGASIVEKHLTLARADGGPDAAFSLEPAEFKDLVDSVRIVEQALGEPTLGPGDREKKNLAFRRSLFVVENIAKGETFTERNVRSIRPSHGLPPRHLPEILGRQAARNLERGTPLGWDDVEG